MQSFHLRADLDAVAAAVTEHLGAEGFTATDNHDADDPAVRRVALYAERGWVGLAEDPFATAAWGPVLSEALGAEVVTLAGERDHAFYTHVFVHADGVEKHAARVPEDITLDDDGQHRLRADFLGAPLVVNELGGESNMQVIGEVLGVPRPRFHVEDAPSRTLYFAYTSDAPPKVSELAALVEGFKIELAPFMRALMGVRAKKTDGPPRLVPCASPGPVDAFAEQSGHVGTSFLLEDAESAKGLTVSLYGDGLALFEAERLRARVADREWTAPAAKREGLVTFTLPDVELAQPPARPDTSHLPIEERLRRGMKRLGSLSIGSNRAEVTMWIEGRFVEAGEGELAITARLNDHETSAATTELAMNVKPPMRAPILPAGASAPHPSYVESYDARERSTRRRTSRCRSGSSSPARRSTSCINPTDRTTPPISRGRRTRRGRRASGSRGGARVPTRRPGSAPSRGSRSAPSSAPRSSRATSAGSRRRSASGASACSTPTTTGSRTSATSRTTSRGSASTRAAPAGACCSRPACRSTVTIGSCARRRRIRSPTR